MSGGVFKSVSRGVFNKPILKAVNKTLHPLKKLGGDIMGTRAAREQAKAIQQQTEAQQQQYQRELQQEQQQNQLDSQGDLSNVATVTAGGTASAADTQLSDATRKNRKQLISSTLGL